MTCSALGFGIHRKEVIDKRFIPNADDSDPEVWSLGFLRP